ncbi:hypothetical protein GGI04_004689 [Coemansia thaxteri]|uniref:Major facilitator superfamily (MFS) profile domain-containing protein n=1 Tax=Coemansia thaxteri TaxID=2663907 RepID=A0A9W8EJC8_9FUNG|nr:hypothetical protein GGI04_004689 [Coemansia thaxteri]KAJ2006448.1 hypothetical protein H4R26_001361 [Coemansia thaxteri]KAJ2486955.1 hypothetical protein EV174_000804 [Coemansia sp. RSA 2320]
MSQSNDDQVAGGAQELPEARVEPVEVKETPMPWAQLLPLVAVRLSEPITMTLILPFIYNMVEGFGIAEAPKDISFYASMLFTSFSIGQTFTVFHWGRLSDRIGRRPVLIYGTTGILVTSLLIGFSKTFTMALLARSLAGAFTGNAMVMKTVIAEIADDTNRVRMMSFLPLTWNAGSMIGAGIGGIFAEPATQYPGVFGNSKLFTYFPYLLPCLVGSIVTIVGLFSGIFKFKETLVRPTEIIHVEAANEQPAASASGTESTPLLAQSATVRSNPAKPKSTKELLTPTVIRVMLTNASMYLAFIMCDQLYPVFAATNPRDGGLGLDPPRIGLSLAVEGLVVVYIQLYIYPRLERKYGVLYCYRQGLKCVLPYLVVMPFLSILALRVQDRAETSASSATFEYVVMWIIIMTLMTTRVTSSVLTFSSINLMIINMAPTRADLGFMNGAQQVAMSVTRVVGPIISGTLWSWSIKHSLPFPFNSHLVWMLSTVLILVGLRVSLRIPESVNVFAAGQPPVVVSSEDAEE